MTDYGYSKSKKSTGNSTDLVGTRSHHNHRIDRHPNGHFLQIHRVGVVSEVDIE